MRRRRTGRETSKTGLGIGERARREAKIRHLGHQLVTLDPPWGWGVGVRTLGFQGVCFSTLGFQVPYACRPGGREGVPPLHWAGLAHLRDMPLFTF